MCRGRLSLIASIDVWHFVSNILFYKRNFDGNRTLTGIFFFIVFYCVYRDRHDNVGENPIVNTNFWVIY